MFTETTAKENRHFCIEMSTWSHAGFPDPINPLPRHLYKSFQLPKHKISEYKLIKTENQDGEVALWRYRCPSGAQLTVFND